MDIKTWAYILLLAVLPVLSVAVVKFLDKLKKKDVESETRTMRERAEHEIETRRKEAELEIKEAAIKQKADSEQEIAEVRKQLHDRERQLDKRDDAVEQQQDQLRKQERMVESTQRKLAEKIDEVTRRDEELKKLLDLQRQTLHELSGMGKEEAAARLLEMLDREMTQETGAIIAKHEKAIAEVVDVKSRELLLTSIQRYAAAHTAETTTSTVDIPNDDMKGRVIGREGRNIRAFEKETGVDVIIDDTPGVVIVSAFDPVRREVARLALSKLITDGRIHPGRIEEIVKETQKEMDEHVRRWGEEAAQEVQVHGLNERTIDLLGRLRLRTSYSQNVLRHSIEVAFLSGQIASELGLDPALARRCGLLHDIGKAADHEAEGGHPKIGADLLKRYGEGPEVVHAALGHHDDIRLEHPFTVIVATADACSASRPGARRETLDRYIKRMEELESLAVGFTGVQQAFAIQAGREVRVIADAKNTTDESAAKICRDIAKIFEERLTYPGEIKVTVLRETRATELAK
ncbi:MAG: ribonuclease Y [Planctomycetota bacterium]|nr:MAG: ribonuclease Y [Planctomycetota bacterium]REK46760.1 MAG: ribonuclease Y [Planctomycetota bacterium]